MLVERVELTLSHVDLGRLNELAAMTLFGNAHSHHITLATGNTICDITDQAGAALYPGYYWTHLKVPPARLLQQHQVWDTVAVGVEVHGFGSTLLSSVYVLGRPDEVGDDPAAWRFDELPAMRGGNMFTAEGADGEPRPAVPKRGAVATLPQLTAAPASLQRFREVREQPSIDPGFAGRLTHPAPIPYALRSGRDVRPNRGIMFARYLQIADLLERQLLTELLWPPLPVALVDTLQVLERETCYFGNVRGEHLLRGTVRAMLERCPPTFHGGDKELVSAGILTSVIEIYDEANVLLVTSRSRKLLAVPSAQSRLLIQVARIMAAHAQSPAQSKEAP